MSKSAADVGDVMVCLGRKRSTDVVLINHGTDGLWKAVSAVTEQHPSTSPCTMWSLPIRCILSMTHQCLLRCHPGSLANDGYTVLFHPLSLSLSGGEGWGCRGLSIHKDQPQRVACPTSQGPVSGVIDDVFITRCGSRGAHPASMGSHSPKIDSAASYLTPTFIKSIKSLLPNVSHT